MRTVLLICAFALVCACPKDIDIEESAQKVGLADETVESSENRTLASLVVRLQSPDSRSRTEAYKEILNQRREFVDALLAIAGKTREQYSFNDSRQLAVELLAKLGDERAIPLFVVNVEYRQQMLVDEVSWLDGYPCALALREIGEKSVPHIFDYLRSPHSTHERLKLSGVITERLPITEQSINLYARILLEIYNPNIGGHQEATRVVRRALEKSSPQQKSELQKLLAKLEEITKHYTN